MQRKIIVLCLFFLVKNFQAQNSENELGTWYMYNGSHKVSKKYTLKTSAHIRFFELASEYQQEIYRLGINYRFNKKLNVTGGMVYSITDTSYKEDLPNLYEFRFYQDANYKQKWASFLANHRIRLAQRFTAQNSKKETRHRIRYGLFLNYPLSTSFKIYTFNEVFIKFARKSFSQNRTGIGIIQKINKQINLRLGYMHTLFSNASSHRLQLGIILNTNHIKTN